MRRGLRRPEDRSYHDRVLLLKRDTNVEKIQYLEAAKLDKMVSIIASSCHRLSHRAFVRISKIEA